MGLKFLAIGEFSTMLTSRLHWMRSVKWDLICALMLLDAKVGFTSYVQPDGG